MAQAVLWDAVKLAQEVLAGQGQPGGELGALQRAAQAAAEPLIALGQATASTALGYLGSSTAVALTSGLGVLRLGLGVPLWKHNPQSLSYGVCKDQTSLTLLKLVTQQGLFLQCVNVAPVSSWANASLARHAGCMGSVLVLLSAC